MSIPMMKSLADKYPPLECGCVPGTLVCDHAQTLRESMVEAYEVYVASRRGVDSAAAWERFTNVRDRFTGHFAESLTDIEIRLKKKVR